MWILARLLMAHLMSDVFLNLFSSEKRNGSLSSRVRSLGLHTVIVFATTLLFFVDKLDQRVLLCVILVGVSHLLIDALRLRIEDTAFDQPRLPPRSKREGFRRLWSFLKNPRASWAEAWFRKWLLLNILDQCLHLLVLVLVAGYLARGLSCDLPVPSRLGVRAEIGS